MDNNLSSMCPYLGSWRDSETAYMYATGANCCNAGKNPADVDKITQANLCLTRDHATCPRYIAQMEAMHHQG